ncbi:GSCFA domain-containing protein [Aliiroseovarius sp. S253]|uniref:GSCFA domain-containing protein n=1 Tax=Aliiroseovarius sp. S253 TaxID=3415133 RepID=UPI003C7C9C00
MKNPYESLPPNAFWKVAVADPQPEHISGLWKPKFDLQPDHKVSTYGSCFAQHIGRALDARGYCWFCTETVPRSASKELRKRYNYDIFSSRTANIYTTTLLLQWVKWALEDQPVPDEIWEKGGRFYDPFRPTIEPEGFASVEELLTMRRVLLEAFARSVTDADFFVFTLGLTERWINEPLNYEYPMCPGTVGGLFDPDTHSFDNLNHATVKEALSEVLDIFKVANPDLKVILTVSPVPLTATASDHHVLTATTYSKSVLRSVAGELSAERSNVDYFPSYEIITSPVFKGEFYAENLRSVRQDGVDFVMRSFFRDLNDAFGPAENRAVNSPPKDSIRGVQDKKDDTTVCEEELLAAFGPK